MAPKTKASDRVQKVDGRDPTPPVPKRVVKPPVDNAVRAARDQQASAHRTAGPSHHLILAEEHLDLVPTPLGVIPLVHVDVTSYVFELMGNPKLVVPTRFRDAFWPVAQIAHELPVRFGSLGNGLLWVYKDDRGMLHTAARDQVISFEHPALPQLTTGERFALTVNAPDGDISGELVLTAGPGSAAALERLTEARLPELLELEDLQDASVWLAENQLGFGKYELAVMLSNFWLDGLFPQSTARPSFFHLVDGWSHFEAFADVEAKGVAKTVVPIRRDSLGDLSAHAKLDAKLTPLANHKLFGKLDASFERGRFSARGEASYVSDKIQGSIEIELTEMQAARKLARSKLGALAPPEPATDDAPNGLGLTGSGLLEFDFNKWLRGRAEVIVDPDGYITTLGRITPTAQIKLFGRKSKKKSVIDKSDWGVQWIDIVPVPYWWGISLVVHAYVGPALLGDLTVEGVFSTHPGVTRHFSIAGTLVIPAEVGADLDAYFKGGIPKLANAGGEITASAKVQIHAGARPRIGWERPGRANADDPVSGRYFIDGILFGGADVTLGLRGGVTAQLIGKSASWKPLHHSWKLGRLRFQVGGKTYLGSDKEPSTFSYDPRPKQSEADYEQLLSDATVDKLPRGDGKIDEDTPTWQDGVTDAEVEPASSTPTEPTVGPTHVEAPTLAGGDLPADDVVDPMAPPSPPTPAPPKDPATLPKTRPATEMPPPEAAPLADLVEPFVMNGTDHELFLTRGHTPRIEMASNPPRSPLGIRLQGALDELSRAIASPPPGRSATDLQDEYDYLVPINKRVVIAEAEARDLGHDVSHGIPEHFRVLAVIAEDLEIYGQLFNRTDLLINIPAGGTPALVPQTFDESTVQRKLEQQRFTEPERDRIAKNLREVPVGALVAEHIISGRFDRARNYYLVLSQLKKKDEVADTLIVLDLARDIQDHDFKIVFEAQEEDNVLDIDTGDPSAAAAVDVDIAGIKDGVVQYAIAVKRPRDVASLAANLNKAGSQLRAVNARRKAIFAYVSQGTPDELRTTYRGGVVNARNSLTKVEIVMVFRDGTAISAEDL